MSDPYKPLSEIPRTPAEWDCYWRMEELRQELDAFDAIQALYPDDKERRYVEPVDRGPKGNPYEGR